ncbi:hypothetical protein [Sphingomonas sp.]|uniref:hypothetical protein n=1 Tax=Sphingomonas sp. TaxID=28214 RepID=UPI0035C81E79
MRIARAAALLALFPAACSAQSSPTSAPTPRPAASPEMPVAEQPVAAPTAAATAQSAMLPDRTLSCTLGRITNPDPSREQTDAEIVYEGKHAFSLLLPGGPARTTPPPDATDDPDPVNPRTRILADPDGLTRGFPNRFDRVIDLWPQRVEMTTTIDQPRVNLIIVNPIDAAAGTAMLFMTQATDAATFDMQHLYRGPCTVKTAAAPRG